MTREEHLQWCKDRAMECVRRGELVDAVASMASDMQKHEETAFKGGALGMLTLFAAQKAQQGDRAEVERFVQGFN